ncbi:TolC family protein [Brevundimonas terrae]|uniref:TolC family protein n=2 Tax=Brevundimonas terrae TaxID=363631 RepID=A0ABN0XZZ4_9CAUL
MNRNMRNIAGASTAVLALLLTASHGLAATSSTVQATSAAARAQDNTGDIELAAAVREALMRDPDVRMARAEIEVAEVEGSIARNGYLPAINASAGPESSGVGYDVTVSQTLYDWGQVRSNVDRTDALTSRQQTQMLITRDDVALQVSEQWLDIAGGRAQLALIHDHLERLGRLQNMAQERVTGRFSDQAELGRANLAVSIASALRARLNGELAEAEEIFRVLVGREAGSVRLPQPTTFLIPLRAPAALEQSIVASPLYRRSVLEAEAADATFRESQAARYPRLVLEGSVMRREIGGRLVDDSAIGLRLRMNTQQGFSTFQRPRLEAARRDAARLGADGTARDLKRTLGSLVVNDRALEDRISALSDQVTQSGAVRTAYAEQFIVGRRDIQDLIVMESEYFEAERQILELTVERLRNQYRAAAQLGQLADSFVSGSGSGSNTVAQ